ncbi:MAG TPA: copper-binding protein [Roseiarcus sp.]|nr:copper-binding protein [Roseiarcus sp.]
MRTVLAVLTAALLAGAALAEEATSGLFSGHGMVVAVQPGTGALTIKHDEIKGFMDAMEMMYKVRSPDVSKDLRPGDEIDFTIDAAKYEILDARLVARSP